MTCRTLDPARARPRPAASRRGVAVVAVVILLAVVNLAVLAGLEAGADDASAAALRIETARAFYAADAGAIIVLRALSHGTAVPGAGTEIPLPSSSLMIVSAPGSGAGDVEIQGTSGLATRRVLITIDN